MMIRPANADDIPTTVSVIRRACATVAERFGLTPENCPKNPAFYTEDRLRDDLARGVRYYFLEENAKVRGCVALEQAEPDVCYLERLAVLPEHRARGLGTALVHHALDQARAFGVSRVEIGIISEDVALKTWYRKFGFVQTSTRTFEHLPFVVAFMAVEL